MLSTACKRVVPDCELVLARLFLQENLAVDLVARFNSLFGRALGLSIHLESKLNCTMAFELGMLLSSPFEGVSQGDGVSIPDAVR